MALEWDITKIKNNDEVCRVEDEKGEKYLSPITQGIIFATCSIGIGEITEQNWEEFFTRFCVVEKIYGKTWTLPNDEDELVETGVTPKMIHDHIGLRTNVFPKLSKTKFLSNLFNGVERTAKYKLQDYKKESAHV